MTPLGLRAAAGVGAHLVARPSGVLHAYVGPLTPSGRRVPRAGRAVCKTRTRTLTVIPLPTVGARMVCGSCMARLSAPNGEAGHSTRDQALALYAGVTRFDLAVDAWRAETPADIERLEFVALLLFTPGELRRLPVLAPSGKETPPLHDQIATHRLRVCGTRDYLSPSMRATAVDNEQAAREAVRLRKGEGWRDREARIERLGFVNATRTA